MYPKKRVPRSRGVVDDKQIANVKKVNFAGLLGASQLCGSSDEMKWILKILLFFGVAFLGLKLMGSVVTYRDAEPQQKL